MKRKSTKIRTKFHEFGKTIGLEESDIDHAKRTAKTLMSMCLIVGFFALIGIFSSRLEAVGAWYAGASIRDFQIDFGFFSRFFRFF